MNHYPVSILNLIKNLSKLPGIGEKTAERLAIYLLGCKESEAMSLAESIADLKKKIRLCSICFTLSDTDICHLCNSPARDNGSICVVEQPADMASIEKSGAFKGRYHVLGGVLSPMDNVGPNDIRFKELEERVRKGDITELILATGTNIEGDATASFISHQLESYPITITRIASGIPVGGDIKYTDLVTLRKAMETRHGL